MLLFAWVAAFCGLVFWRLGGPHGGGADGARNRVNLVFIIGQIYVLLPYVVGGGAGCWH